MTSSQPEAVAILRDKLEALYQADVASNSGEMSEIQKLGVDLWTELMKAKEARLPRAGEVAEREEKESVLEWSLVEKHFEDDVSSSDMDSRREPSNFTVRPDCFEVVAWDWVLVMSNCIMGLFWRRCRFFYRPLRGCAGNWAEWRPQKTAP